MRYGNTFGLPSLVCCVVPNFLFLTTSSPPDIPIKKIVTSNCLHIKSTFLLGPKSSAALVRYDYGRSGLSEVMV